MPPTSLANFAKRSAQAWTTEAANGVIDLLGRSGHLRIDGLVQQRRPSSGVTLRSRCSSLAAGSVTKLSFTAGQTDLFDFRVSVGALPAGLQVAYPGGKTSSGLNGDSTLEGRSTDYVGIRFTAGPSLQRGTYTIPLAITYTAATAVTTTGSVTLVVS